MMMDHMIAGLERAEKQLSRYAKRLERAQVPNADEWEDFGGTVRFARELLVTWHTFSKAGQEALAGFYISELRAFSAFEEVLDEESRQACAAAAVFMEAPEAALH